MPCQELSPLPTCGTNGKCVPSIDESNITVNYCVCSDGFSQSLEFNYFDIEGGAELSNSICFYHKTFIMVLYVCVMFFSFVNFTAIYYFSSKSIYKTTRRNKSWILFLLLVFVWAGIRVFDDKIQGIGVDLGYTILFSIFCPLAQTGGYLVTKKYFNYLSKRVNFAQTRRKTIYRAENAQLVFFIILIINAVSLQFAWISILVDSRQTALVMIRIMFAAVVSFHLAAVIFTSFTVSEFNADMRKYIEMNKESKFHGAASKAEQVEWMQKRIPQLKKFKRGVTFVGLLLAFMAFYPVVWNLGLLTWAYLLPVHIIALFLYSMSTIIGHKRIDVRTSTGDIKSNRVLQESSTANTFATSTNISSKEAAEYSI